MKDGARFTLCRVCVRPEEEIYGCWYYHWWAQSFTAGYTPPVQGHLSPEMLHVSTKSTLWIIDLILNSSFVQRQQNQPTITLFYPFVLVWIGKGTRYYCHVVNFRGISSWILSQDVSSLFQGSMLSFANKVSGCSFIFTGQTWEYQSFRLTLGKKCISKCMSYNRAASKKVSNQISAAGPEIASLLFHVFFFLVKTLHCTCVTHNATG